MLALKKSQEKKACTPNIVPCRIAQTGPAKVSKRFWSPKDESDGTQTAYFRGRKLRGRKLKVPEGYEGIIAKEASTFAPTAADKVDNPPSDSDDEEDKPEPVKMLDVAATFDNVVVWGHEVLPPADDTFVKGIQEWISFAETIHVEASDGK